jgi:hypothetical protein
MTWLEPGRRRVEGIFSVSVARRVAQHEPSLDLSRCTTKTQKMAESLQQLVLETLDKSGVIEDTRTIYIPGENGPALSNDAQITILGALNSLASRDVRSWPFLRIDPLNKP